ncbi:heterokaryon incompatibility protein-domain-containing protein [Annulohypoxylon bovei var. microspora]|nr:heterokaryon incompatibility protein-domain-containing protein [Annulohypoxylon bovei var. microspora]
MPILRDIRESIETYRKSTPWMDSTHPPRISSNQLRLLEPAVRNRDTLHFTVHTVLRSQAPPYTALSYTWGDSAATKTIYLNETPFQVTPNLWSCLYHLIQDGKKFLWVDAICINQNDNVEKSIQVRCMDQTYRDAVCVSVWLGPIPSPPVFLTQPATRLLMGPLRGDVVGGHDSTWELANRPYWSRVWVIQEFLLGKDVEIWYGNDSMNIDKFQDIILEHAGVKLHEIQGMDYATSNSSYKAWSLITSRTPDRHPEFSHPLWRLLVDHRHAMCKDPRDKVFALLALIPAEERDLLGRFLPNYDLSEDHVVIITLMHLQEYSQVEDDCPEITLDSDDIFLALGVHGKSPRRKLLSRVSKVNFDYFQDLKCTAPDTARFLEGV